MKKQLLPPLILTLLYVWPMVMRAQQTPQELGQLVFTFFKTQNYTGFDTLTPTTPQIIEIYHQKDSSFHFEKARNFSRNYLFHDAQFKKKCKRFITDTIYFKADWQQAILTQTEYYEKEIPPSDSLSATREPYIINYLDIYFTSNQDQFLIQFKHIYKYNDIWKLGENVRFKKLNEQ